MNIACISASNVQHSKGNSTSTRVCQRIEGMIHIDHGPEVAVDIIALSSYELTMRWLR